MTRRTDVPGTSPQSSTSALARRRQQIESDELRQRMERLEERLDDSFLGDDGLAEFDQSLDPGKDKSSSANPSREAVERLTGKRTPPKA